MRIHLTFLFLQLCHNKWHNQIQREKIHNLGISKSDFKANRAAGSAKNVFWGGSMQDQNTVFDLPAIPYIVKTFWNAPELCIFWLWIRWGHLFWSLCRDDKDTGDFPSLRVVRDHPKRWKSPRITSCLQICRKILHPQIQRQKIHNPGVVKSFLG